MGRALTIFIVAACLVQPVASRAVAFDDEDSLAEGFEDTLLVDGEVEETDQPSIGEDAGAGTALGARVAASLVRDARRLRVRIRTGALRPAMFLPATLPLALGLIAAVFVLRARLHRALIAKPVRVLRAIIRPRPPLAPPLPAPPRIARVLIADDSPTTRAYLQAILHGSAGLQVIGQASDGMEALSLAFLLRPDVIVMDLDMPEMNGFEATARIMKETPTAVAAVSSNFDVCDTRISGRVLQAGAVALLLKPLAPNHADFERSARMFAETIAAVGQSQAGRKAA